eukprot:6586891-Pyramimonas_sp.AAC.1
MQSETLCIFTRTDVNKHAQALYWIDRTCRQGVAHKCALNAKANKPTRPYPRVPVQNAIVELIQETQLHRFACEQ